MELVGATWRMRNTRTDSLLLCLIDWPVPPADVLGHFAYVLCLVAVLGFALCLISYIYIALLYN